MKTTYSLKLIFLTISIALPMLSAATVIDFSAAPGGGGHKVYDEDGLRFTALDTGFGGVPFNHFDFDFGVPGDRELGLHQGNNAEALEIDSFGSTFDLTSLLLTITRVVHHGP